MAVKTLLIHFLKLGVGIASTEMEYADSTSSDTPPTTGWQTTPPQWQDGHYIWTRTHITYTNGKETYTSPVCTTGSQGQQGERGAVLRGPQLWSDCGVGYCFEAGETGKEWKDTVIYNDNTYSCVKSHVKTADNYPGSADDINNGYWRVGSPIELIVANIIMSRYQLVKNLGVETIEMKDADGNIVFRAKDGEVLANKGTFNNIVCDHGEFTNAVVTGDLNMSTLRYLANWGGNMGAAVMAKAFNMGYGPFILPHLNDNECMRVVFYNPVITRSSLPAKVSCQGSNDVLKPASNIYTPTSYCQIEVSGWCEMIGSNLTSGKTTWIYNYIVQS